MNESGYLISTRRRVVWTIAERRQLDKVAKMFNVHGDKFKLVCGSPVCPSPDIALAQDDTNPAGRVLRCGCSDRVFSQVH